MKVEDNSGRIFAAGEVSAAVLAARKRMLSECTVDTLKALLQSIDLTSLNGSDTTIKIGALTDKVNNFASEYPDCGNVAAICVYPALVPVVRERLTATGVHIAAVGAGFPASQTFLSVKANECELTVEKGADEIDIVISVGSFLEGDLKKVAAEITILKKSVGPALLKVILETGELKTDSNIYSAAMLAMESGADFIKTSTGKTAVSATPEAVYVMCCAINDYHAQTGRMVGLKPAGGISTANDALLYYTIVKNVLGEAWLTNKLFRLGASRLANNLLTEINNLNGSNTTITYF